MNVFISRPNWIPEAFRPGLTIFLSRLSNDMQLTPRTLGSTDYPTKAPLDEVIKLIDQCQGAIVLGYPQIEITAGMVKGECVTERMSLPTEWNHIEAGLAYARSLPLIVISHIGVSRGIFDRGAMNSFLFSKDLTNPQWSIEEDINGAIRSWRNDLLGFSPSTDSKRLSAHSAIAKNLNDIWTVEAVGRKIRDARRISDRYRESTECKVVELTDYYVRVSVLTSGEEITIPFGDVVISYDDKRRRPKLEIRA